MNRSLLQFLCLGWLLLVSTACQGTEIRTPTPAAFDGPETRLTWENDNLQPIPDQALTFRVESQHSRGIERIELQVDNDVVRIDSNPAPEPNTPYIVAQSWTPGEAATYTIRAIAYNTANVAGPSNEITITVLNADQIDLSRPTATPAPAALGDTLPSPTPSPGPPATATTAPATDTPAAQEPEPAPLITPTPFPPTNITPLPRFETVWQNLGGTNSRLGSPAIEGNNSQNYAAQNFDRGVMIWWQNPNGDDIIWVLEADSNERLQGSTWGQYADTWPGEADYSCAAAEANGELGPVRGFGYLWCNNPALQTRLGAAVDLERGSGGNAPFLEVQFFQGGLMLYLPQRNQVYVMFNQGDWQRF